MREIKHTISRYDEIAEYYHKKFGTIEPSDVPYFLKFVELIGKENPKILDCGCGTGRDLKFLENFECELYGIDLSKGMLRVAKQNLNKTSLLRGDYRTLPFKDNYFDGVVSIASLVHLPKKEKTVALREFRRILRPQGVLYISVQNLLYPERFKRALQYWTSEGVYYDGRYWYFPTKYGMESLVEEAGFSILDSSSGLLDKRIRIYAVKL